MRGEIVINGIRMEDGDREILEGCKIYEERKEFWLVYHYTKHIRGGDGREAYEGGYANVNDNIEIQDYPEKSIGEKSKIHKNNRKGLVLGRKNIVRKKKGGVPFDGHCDRVFKSRWNMKRHLDAETEIKCEYCTTFYLRGKRNYQTHMKKMHEKYLKTLKCNKCETEFKGEKSLSMHLKMHDPNYGMFECENCKLFFTQKHSMERHRRNFHK